ncbi:MAG: hypothetical protein JWN67_480 [Actinomycetia bacterium]|nr:hypothetical protein [Actinomycetes bacterium]
MAGYSGTPLDKKLGIKPGHRLLLEGAPDDFVGGTLALPDGVELVTEGPVDLAIVFVTSRAQLEERWEPVTTSMKADAGFWVAWPKKASKVPTDMTEDVVRDVALPGGLVDIKVCAIDDVWSGLRLAVRKENRPSWPWGR